MAEKKDPNVIHMSEEDYQAFSSDPRHDNVKAAELVKKSPDEVQGYRATSDPDKQGQMVVQVYMVGEQMPVTSNQAGENIRGESGMGAPGVPGPAQGAPPEGEGRSDAPVEQEPAQQLPEMQPGGHAQVATETPEQHPAPAQASKDADEKAPTAQRKSAQEKK